MIYTGTDLKFFVKATIDGFSMTDDDFRIVIKNRWGQTKYTIEKDECFSDSDGNFYFTIESVSTGSYYAYFTAIITDDDYDKQTRNIVDKQLLYTVDSCGCHVAKTDCGCDDDCECKVGCLTVSYKQVWTINVDGGTYLMDKDGKFIITADGSRVQTK